ncbi:hypothetical protein [Actinacidiphila paucisporea]|uniref:Lipoprotein n=1 Tax=Actinacidiphila paucisporea TaxID=310782 RepID=A0A1M7CI87_9ACTN|nr:hypothetical protein [Actinacidiphila paucisporea]SHL66519.1 hypothetical protein SAMN05216499_105237 [Actinacidiphila paucisporea]
MRVRRTLAALCTIVPLVWAATGCSDTSAGRITATRGLTFAQTISNPIHGRCHAFAPRGVDRVTNQLGSDIVLHKGPRCTDPVGRPSSYLSSTFSASAVVSLGRWRSFSMVGWSSPVSPN